MGHAEDDLVQTELTAALDDLLERRDHRLAAIEAEALGAGVFDIEEVLEALGLDQLVEDGPLALGGVADALVGTLDALLDPRLLARIGDVHELDPKRRAVGALENGDDLVEGRPLEAEDIVDEDRAVHVLRAETVGGRIELGMGLGVLEAQRIEIGGEMAADAIGADHHQGADRIEGRLAHLGRRDLGRSAIARAAGGAGLAIAGQRRPIAVEGRDDLAIDGLRPVGAAPRRALGSASGR